MSFRERIGITIKEKRQEVGIPQRVIADHCGVTTAMICRAEQGKKIGMDLIEKIFDVLDLEIVITDKEVCA